MPTTTLNYLLSKLVNDCNNRAFNDFVCRRGNGRVVKAFDSESSDPGSSPGSVDKVKYPGTLRHVCVPVPGRWKASRVPALAAIEALLTAKVRLIME